MFINWNLNIISHSSAVILVLDQALVDGGVLAGGTCARHRGFIQILSNLTKDVPQRWQLIVDWGLIDTATVCTVGWVRLSWWIVHHIGICIQLWIIGQWITLNMHGSLSLTPPMTLPSSVFIAASERWFARSIAIEQSCIPLLLARTLLMMAWTWSNLAVVLRHDWLEGLTTGYLRATIVIERIGSEAVNRLLRLLQLGQTVGALSRVRHSVPEIVNWGLLLLLRLHSLLNIFLCYILFSISEATCDIVCFNMPHLRQWIEGGRCRICRRFHRSTLSRWLICWWSRA